MVALSGDGTFLLAAGCADLSWLQLRLRIPMMSISRSEVMAISAERSDARLF